MTRILMKYRSWQGETENLYFEGLKALMFKTILIKVKQNLFVGISASVLSEIKCNVNSNKIVEIFQLQKYTLVCSNTKMYILGGRIMPLVL